MHNLIILGSGRSGTSMLTGILKNAGYFTGEHSDYLIKNKANPKGFFEDYEVNTINEDILKQHLINFPESIRKRFFPSYTFYRARWLARIPLYKRISSNVQIDIRIQEVIKNQPFCFKDPRFSYTLPIWNRFLDSNTKFIVMYREAHKTAESIVRECKESPALKKLKITNSIATGVWASMYLHVLRNYNESAFKENWIFFHYDDIFDIEKVAKLEAFVGLPLDISFAEKQLSRSKEASNNMSKKIARIYNQLLVLS